MARQFIYHMSGTEQVLRRQEDPRKRQSVLLPDAKIGILGPNGAGKSTVLRIIAGKDKEYTGEAWLAEGATVGYWNRNRIWTLLRTPSKTSWKAWPTSRPCSTVTTN